MLSPFLICLSLITGAFAQDNQTTKPATRHRVQLVASDALLAARAGLRIPTAATNERGEFNLRGLTGEYYVVAGPVDQRGSGELTAILRPSTDSAADAAK